MRIESIQQKISLVDSPLYFLTFSGAEDLADRILQDLHLPPYRELKLYDEYGNCSLKFRYGDGSYSEVKSLGSFDKDTAKRGRMIISWNSPYEIIDLSKSNPKLFDVIESKQELKPNRKPHPFDGTVHALRICYQPSKEAWIEVDYTSGVQSKEWDPVLTEDDYIDSDYFNVFTTLRFPLSELGISKDAYRV